MDRKANKSTIVTSSRPLKKGIRIPINSADIIVHLKSKASNIFRDKNIKKDFDIYITEYGDLLIQKSDL